MSKFIKGFVYAGKGIIYMIGTQRNARFHLFAAIFVILAGIWFNLSTAEWLFIIAAIGMVFTAEAINTSIEKVVNLVEPGQNPLAGKAKDLAAGAVLISAIVSMVIGILIFWPHFLEML